MTETEKDRLIAELQEEVATLRTIIWRTPGNVFWTDLKGHFLGCNENMARILGVKTIYEIVGKTKEELAGKELSKPLYISDQEVIHAREEKTYEEQGFREDNVPATYITKKNPLIDQQGNVRGIMGTSFDITERKNMENALIEAKQKAISANNAKSRFLATITHELRTPLTSILGFASLIDQANLEGEKKREYIKHIINSGGYLLSLINSILDYSKLESGNYELTYTPLNFKELTHGVIEMLMGTAKIKNLDLFLYYENDVPEYIISNSRALRQILINLIGNAIKFTERGHVAIQIQSINNKEQSVTLKITVKDTGIGIPPEDQKAIFKRFHQLSHAPSKKNSNIVGTGLGLAIVKKLVKLLNGKIEVHSIPNNGSKFTITAIFNKASLEEQPWLTYASKVKILVAHDNQEQNYIHALLSNSMYEIVSSSEIINVLYSAQQSSNPFEILMIDHELGFMTSNELIHALQDQSDLQQPLLIILNNLDNESNPHLRCLKTSLNPSSADIRSFQTQLKQMWEEKLSSAKTATLKLNHASAPNVLLVEDNVLIQLVHKHLLEDLGYRVDIAESATQALEKLDYNFDILLIDIGLPDMTGLELIKTIRQGKSVAKLKPIIVLTGYSEEEERQNCLNAGANAVAIKPISKTALAALLEQYLKKTEAL